MEEIGFGWLKLSPNALYDLTPREFKNMLKGFEQLNVFNNREEWERTRVLASLLLSPHAKKGKSIKPTDLLPFEWDKKEPIIQSKPSTEYINYIDAKRKLAKSTK